MTTIGYARVSTTDQNLGIQIAALKAAGCDVIRSEKKAAHRRLVEPDSRPFWTFFGEGIA